MVNDLKKVFFLFYIDFIQPIFVSDSFILII